MRRINQFCNIDVPRPTKRRENVYGKEINLKRNETPKTAAKEEFFICSQVNPSSEVLCLSETGCGHVEKG